MRKGRQRQKERCHHAKSLATYRIKPSHTQGFLIQKIFLIRLPLMNHLAASSGESSVIPCLTEPGPYLIRGNPDRLPGFRLEFIRLRRAGMTATAANRGE
jgi:hypothetical protein